MTATTDLDYLSHRAEREAVMAASAGDQRVAVIHEELSRRYAEQVVRGLGERPVAGWAAAMQP